jgi:hypothetical protein
MDMRMKRSRAQEKHVASKSGGKTRPGSGSRWFAPGDIKSKLYLISCKTTTKKSFSLKQKDLEEIKVDAFMEDKTPLMQVDFGGRKVWIIEDSYIQFDDETGKISIE